jgi:hypothetical protein
MPWVAYAAVAVTVLAALVALWVRRVEPVLFAPRGPAPAAAPRARPYSPPPPRPTAGLSLSPGPQGNLEFADALLVAAQAYRDECAARAAPPGLPRG